MRHLIWILCLVPNFLWGQGEVSVLFLSIPPSPSLNGMGAVGTALPSDDPFAFHFNPAQLGQTGSVTNLSAHFYPAKVEWLPGLIPDVTYNNSAFTLGYKFKNTFLKSPLKLGLGYMSGKIDYGTSYQTDDQGQIINIFNPYESYQAYSFGVGVDYFVQISAGITFKKFESKLAPAIVGIFPEPAEAEGSAKDFGVLFNLPAIKPPVIEAGSNNSASRLYPVLDVSVGYSILNIGDEVFYIDASQADPIPRTARLGYGLKFVMGYRLQNSVPLQMFGFDWAVEAEDILIEQEDQGFKYQGMFGDINIWNNIIRAKGDDKVVRHWGLRFRLAETFLISLGNFNGRGFENYDTNGIGLSIKGLLKFLDSRSSNQTLHALSEHFDLRYYNSNYFAGLESETSFQGIAVIIGGF